MQFSNPSPHSTTPRWVRVFLPVAIISIAWTQEIVDNLFFGGQWKFLTGPDQPFWSIIFSWFSHEDFKHLIGNTAIFLPLSWLVLWQGVRDYASVFACVFLVELVNQLFWPEIAHGISDIVYGMLGYLTIIGVLEKRFLATLLSVLALILYGKYLPALLPWNNVPGSSWLGHFSGFAGGIIGALGIYREPNRELHDGE